MGFLSAILFAGFLSLLLRRLLRSSQERRQATFATVIAISPAILLGIERANVDAWLFMLCVLALLALQRSYYVTSGLLVTLAALLKISPIGGMLPLLDARHRRSLFVLLPVLAIGILTTARELSMVGSSAPQSCIVAFGVSVIPICVTQAFGASTQHFIAFRVLGIALFAVTSLAIWWLRRHSRRTRGLFDELSAEINASTESRDAFLFVVGLALSTYLLGTVFDYKWMFLAPLLLLLAGTSSALGRVLAYLLLAALLLSGDIGRIALLGDLILAVVLPLQAVLIVGTREWRWNMKSGT